ncbi:MAG: hypothetical protein AAFO29_07435, partial [Actinomycetota bacterium]
MADDSSRSEKEPTALADPGAPLLDRSRARVRLPAELFTPALELAEIQSMVHAEARQSTDAASKKLAVQLANLMDGDHLDPIAVDVLQV